MNGSEVFDVDKNKLYVNKKDEGYKVKTSQATISVLFKLNTNRFYEKKKKVHHFFHPKICNYLEKLKSHFKM